ncbi:MAG: PAS domain-containing protein [Phycisphaeraceae bacterium]|nr:PAS domain-containing protein [Phycisphaeraceae bacterium]
MMRTVVSAWAIMLAGMGGGAVWIVISNGSRESVWFLIVLSVAGTLAVGIRGLRWARQLKRIEASARSLVDWTLASTTKETTAEPPGGAARLEDDEFSTLRATILELGRRLSGHLKELAKKSRNLESLIDALDEPVIATDNQERVLLCNRSAESLLGAGPGRVVGQPIDSLFTQDDLLRMHAAARAGEVRRGRVKVTTPLGPRVFQVSAAPLQAAWGEGVFGAVLLLRDVTELDRADQVKTDFVANASHELRTPVATIRGSLETLLDGAKDDPEMGPKLLRMALSHAERLEEMTRDLLDLSRLESPDLIVEDKALDLDRMETSLRGMFEDICSKRRLSLSLEFDAGLRGVRTDPRLVNLILRNLVENATKFAYEGTTIRVRGRVGPVTPGGGRDARGVARFEVLDKGIGIPLNVRERVFERYFQVEPARTGTGNALRGTGLGLAIAKHAARALDGEIGLDSVYREGTTAWVELPVVIGG